MPGILVSLAHAQFTTMPILVGSCLLIRPDLIVPFLFKNAPAPTGNGEMVDILRKGFAIRDIYMGITLGAALYHGNRRVVGWSLIAGFCVAATDGYALNQSLGRGLWDHWSFLPVLLGLGVWQAFF